MKIVIIVNTVSSLINFRADLLHELVFNKHEVFAFATDYSYDNSSKLIEWGVTPIKYKLSRAGINPYSDLKTIISLQYGIRKIKPDIVLSHFVKPVIYGSIAAKLENVPKRIAMLEGLGYFFTIQPKGLSFRTRVIQRVQVLLYRFAFSSINHLFFLNNDDRHELIVKNKLKADNVSVLGGIGVNLVDFPYTRPQTEIIRFLFIGRLLKEKGIFEFIDAVKIVKEKFPNAEFVILGSTDVTSPNPLSIKYLNSLVEKGLVIYPGQVENVLHWINDCSVFVLPSYREGLPKSSQEAMAVGRPILTTDVPGCRETVVDGENGFLVPAFDVQKLVEKMIWFIEHPKRIEPMGLISRLLAEEKFDVHKVNAKILEIMGL
jgi:glycosyltransferase involved in cell wall biosynthesis